MAAAKLSIKILESATFYKKFVWKDSRKRAINLTGSTAKMQVRAVASFTSPVLLEFSTENGRIRLNEKPGQIELLLSAAETEALDFTSGVYDLVITDALGGETRLIEGRLTVSKGVTR